MPIVRSSLSQAAVSQMLRPTSQQFLQDFLLHQPTVFLKYSLRPGRNQPALRRPFAALPASLLNQGDLYQLPLAGLQWFNSQWVGLQFWSVTGGVDGSFVTTDNPPAQRVMVGSEAVIATAWYVPMDPCADVKTGTPAIWIDAFNRTTGQFISGNFVTANREQFTRDANDAGAIRDAGADLDLEAYRQLGGAEFVEWTLLGGVGQAQDEHLHVPQGQSVVALALYETPTPPTRPNPSEGASDPLWFLKNNPAAVEQLLAVQALHNVVAMVNPESQTVLRAAAVKYATSASNLLTEGIMSWAEGDKKLASDVVEKGKQTMPLASAVVIKKK